MYLIPSIAVFFLYYLLFIFLLYYILKVFFVVVTMALTRQAINITLYSTRSHFYLKLQHFLQIQDGGRRHLGFYNNLEYD